MLERAGRIVVSLLASAGAVSLFAFKVLRELFVPPFEIRETIIVPRNSARKGLICRGTAYTARVLGIKPSICSPQVKTARCVSRSIKRRAGEMAEWSGGASSSPTP
jgi:hypothetical protein